MLKMFTNRRSGVAYIDELYDVILNQSDYLSHATRFKLMEHRAQELLRGNA